MRRVAVSKDKIRRERRAMKEQPGIGYAGPASTLTMGRPLRASLESALRHMKNAPTIDLVAERKMYE